MRRVAVIASCLLIWALPLHAKDFFQSAQTYHQQGDWRAAVIELKNLLSEQPDHASGRLLLGELYLGQGDYVSAEKELSRARDLNADDPRLSLLLAKSLLGQGRTQKAVDLLGPKAPSDPDLAQEYWALNGDLHRSRQQLMEAEYAYHQALKLGRSPAAKAGLISLALLRQQPDQALELVRSVGHEEQTSAIKQLEGEAYLHKRQLEDALKAYEGALVLQPDNLFAALSKARTLALMGEDKQATSVTDRILARTPKWPEALILSAALQLRADKAEQAKQTIDELLVYQPEASRLLYLGAQANLKLGHIEQAKHQLELFVRQTGDPRARILLANLHQDNNDLVLAEKVLAPLLDPANAEGDAFAVLGLIRMKKGDAEGAADAFRQSLELGSSPKVGRPLAVSELLSGDHQAGTQRLEAFAAQEVDPKTDVLLIRAYLANQQPDKARQLMQQRIEGEKMPSLYRLMAASLEVRLQNYDAATTYFDQHLRDEPDSLAALMGLAFVRVQTEDLPAAMAFYQRAMRVAPEDLRPLQGYVNSLLLQGDQGQALEVAGRHLKQNPDNLDATKLYLDTLQRAQQTEQLEKAIQRAINQFPDAPELQLAAARLAYSKQQFREVDALLNKLTLQHPEYWPGRIAKIKRQLEMAQGAAALEGLGQLPERMQYLPATRLLKADALFATQAYSEAEQIYLSVYQDHPSPEIMVKLAQVSIQQNKVELALKRLQQQMDEHPDDLRSAMMLAMLRMQVNDYAAAISLYEHVTEQQPQQVVAWNNLAWLYHEQSDPRAIAAAQQALALAPNAAEVMDTAGWVFLNAGRDQQALELLSKAAEGLEKNPSVQYHFAEALARNNQPKAALSVLGSILMDEFPEKSQASALLKQLAASR